MKNRETMLLLYQSLTDLAYGKDIDLITVKELTQHASVSRSTFYLYFSNINEMIEQMENRLLESIPSTLEVMDETKGICLDDCHAEWIHQWFLYFERYKNGLNALLGPHGDKRFYQKIKKRLIGELNHQMNLDGFPDDTIRKYFQSIYAETFLILAMEWTQKKYKDDLTLASLCQIALAFREKKD